MKLRETLLMLVAALLLGSFYGCSTQDAADYKLGMTYLAKDSNWQLASRAFSRAVQAKPKNWKYNIALLEAMSRGEDPKVYEETLRNLLRYYPDSTRSTAIVNPSIKLLGSDRYYMFASSFALKSIGDQLASKRNDKNLLARGIMVACRAKDTLAAMDYFERYLDAAGNDGLADSVVQEMNFFIGTSMVNLHRLEWRVNKDPNDIQAWESLLDFGVLVGDAETVKNRLKTVVDQTSDKEILKDLAKRYGMMIGFDPFDAKTNMNGWDATYTPDGNKMVFVRDMGNQQHPDVYFYMSNKDGTGLTPILKAVQDFLQSVAMPRFGPDGWLYFYGTTEKNWKIGKQGRFQFYRMQPRWGSSPQKLVDADLLPSEPFFNSDGTVLIVRRDLGSTRASVEILKVFPDKKRFETVSRVGEPVVCASFSPNGDSLIFVTDRGIFRRSTSGGNITVDLTWTGFRHIQVSPNGNFMYLIDRDGTQILVDRKKYRPAYLGKSEILPAFFTRNDRLLVTKRIGNDLKIVEYNLNANIQSLDAFKAKL